jgi:uncharacterized membrane protein YedE/YeeE
MRPVRWSAWTIGALFLVGTALQLVDTLNLYVTPPDTGASSMVAQRLASQDYRVAIWPVFALNNLSFGIAFVLIAGLGLALAALLSTGGTRRTAILTTLGVAGILGAVGQLILLGATQVTIDIAYCDCGFKETEIVAQIWAQMLANGASQALVDAATILAAIGIVVVASTFRRAMPAPWEIWSWLTATALIAGFLVRFLSLGSEDLGLILFVVISGVLVPVWAFWLGWSFGRDHAGDAASDA